FKHRRYSFTLDIIQPIFRQNLGVEKKARKSAIKNALAHATLLAEGAKLELDEIVEIEELSPIIGAEGVYNDDLEAISTPSNNNGNFKSLENPSREITVRCRVSFSTKILSDNTTPLNTVDFS
ncbi:MAG: SIMPL domain-containing protein, partial [Cyanobacteria bacterium J06635_10]